MRIVLQRSNRERSGNENECQSNESSSESRAQVIGGGTSVGYANTVTEEGWKLFRERLIQAVEVLASARKLKSQSPRWWTAILQAGVGLSMPRAEYDRLFEEGLRAYPQYSSLYTRKANYLLPRWHGKLGEWERFLTEAADKIGGQDGDMLYARVAWLMEESTFGNIFEESETSWSRVERGFKVIEASFPNSLTALNQMVYLAYLGCDRPQAQIHFARLNGEVDLSVWGTREKFMDKAGWANAR